MRWPSPPGGWGYEHLVTVILGAAFGLGLAALALSHMEWFR